MGIGLRADLAFVNRNLVAAACELKKNILEEKHRNATTTLMAVSGSLQLRDIFCFGLAACNDENKQSVPSPPAIREVAMFGDRVIQGMVRVQLTFAPPFNTALNYGIGGQTSRQIADRVSPAASTVFLEGGGNEFILGLPLDGIAASYRRMLGQLSSVQVRIIGIPHVDEAVIDRKTFPNINNAGISEINANLVQICAEYPNCKPATAAMQLSVSGLTSDGIHLRPENYPIFVAALAQSL